jgi:serine/threonine-protein kinase
MMARQEFRARAQWLLQRFVSVPSDQNPAHSFLQKRLALYLTIVLSLWTAAFVVEQVASLFLSGHLVNFHGPRSDAGAYLATFIAVLVLQAAMLAVARTRSLTPTVARCIEVLVTLAMISHACFTLAGRPITVRPDVLMLYIATTYLMLRAATMPESSRSALLSGLLVMALVLGATVFVHRRATGTLAPTAITEIAAQAVLAAVSIALTTTITFVIYGLRERVRAARQLGPYTLMQKVGEGGMGVVYRARHALLRRPTAVKVLITANAAEGQTARFEQEVQLTADLSHPNIVSVYDFGRSPDGAFYYAMEYVDGIDLQRLVECDGPQPAARVVHILMQAADALAEAHELGLIHRDVKPANLMLMNHGRRPDQVKVLDFGLAKHLRGDARLPQSGVNLVQGTPLYMAPEAVTNPADVDAQSDLYGLGAVAYFLLSGVPPFRGKTYVEVFARQLYEVLKPPSKQLGAPIPLSLEKLVMSCMAKGKADRPPTAGALLQALRGLDALEWPADAAHAWWQTNASKVTPWSGQSLQAPTGTLLIAPRGGS